MHQVGFSLHDSLTTFAQKTKLMAFKGEDAVRSKTITDNSIIEQVTYFPAHKKHFFSPKNVT